MQFPQEAHAERIADALVEPLASAVVDKEACIHAELAGDLAELACDFAELAETLPGPGERCYRCGDEDFLEPQPLDDPNRCSRELDMGGTDQGQSAEQQELLGAAKQCEDANFPAAIFVR